MDVTGLLGYRLKKTQHALRLQMDEGLRALELTTPQYAVLAQLELESGISNAELARRSFITAQTMHGIVSNLEQRGLIKRASDPYHGRILCAALTTKGAKIVQKAHAIIDDIERKMTASISADNRILLQELLATCLTNLRSMAVQ